MSSRPGILQAAGLVALATMVSRVLGLGREVSIAYLFGGDASTDAFFAAFKVPNLLRDLFAEGALSAALVPTFTAVYHRRGPEAAWRLTSTVINALLVILGGFTVVLLVGARPFVRVVASGFDPAQTDLAATMVRIMSPFLAAVALAAVLMGVLNALGRFFLPALAPALFNVGVIASAWALAGPLASRGVEPALSLAVGALVGGVGQFAFQIPAARRAGFRWSPVLDLRDPGLRRILILMGPAAFGLAATFVNVVVDVRMASYFGEGPISYLNYAFRIWMLPVGVFAVALATANLAQVSRNAADGDFAAMGSTVSQSLRLSLVLTLPATAAFLAVGRPIVEVLYEHRGGEFGPADSRQVAMALAAYAVGLAGYAWVKVLVPTFYALGETWYPVRVAALAVLVKVGLNFVLARGSLVPGFDGLGFSGLALATGVAAWVNAFLLGATLKRRMGAPIGRGVPGTAARTACVAAAMGGLVFWLHRLLATALPGDGFGQEVVALGLVVIVGVAFTGGGLLVAGVGEVRDVARNIRRRILRS